MNIEIRNARRVNEPPSHTGHVAIARFSVVIDDVITLFDFKLTKSPQGRLYCWPPYMGPKTPSSSFHPAIREKVINMVLDDIGDTVNARIAA
jgi:hypothetical protein